MAQLKLKCEKLIEAETLIYVKQKKLATLILKCNPISFSLSAIVGINPDELNDEEMLIYHSLQ